MAVAPFRSTVPLCHHSGRPPHARAPHAGRMTSFRQVSWLAGRDPSPPSRALLCKAQWQPGEGLAAEGDVLAWKARKRNIELGAEHEAVRQHVVVADLQSPEVASRPGEDIGGLIEVERAREIRWRAPVRMPPGVAEMSAHIEAGPIVGLDHRGLPPRLYRHRHFRRHGRSSSQKRRRPCHASQLRDGRTADDTLNTTSHGGRPIPLDSSPLSPLRKTAPCARPARRKDDFVQAGLLARGS